MKPKTAFHVTGFCPNASLALLTAITAFATVNLFAATYQWDGGAGTSDWQTPTNWNPDGTIGAFNTSGAHRLNVNGSQKLVYSSAEGTTVYANTAAGSRGLVIGSGAAGSGTMEITGGTFSTVGSIASDVISNQNSATGRLIINGGNYIGTNVGTGVGIGGGAGRVGILDVLSGTATVATLDMNTSSATVNLDGGTLAVNKISKSGGFARLNLNGGTLQARQNEIAFISGLNTVDVKSGGAVIDTNGFNVRIGNSLLEAAASPGGGLIKKSSGLLTLDAPSTITGAVTVEAGGLGMKAGATSWAPSSLTHSGNTLNFDLGVYYAANPPLITVATLTLNTTDITVNVSGSSIPVSSEIIILDYGTKSGTGSLKLNTASLPVNMVATLQENTVDGYYYLNVTSPSAVFFTWSGDTNPDGTGDWNTTSLNWDNNNAAYAQPALVLFPNITGGGPVPITENVSPLSMDINNLIGNPYEFNGTGLITGNTGIAKAGTGIVKFNGAAHSYTGALAINAGAIIKNVADATTGNITVAADNVSFVLAGGITDGAGQTLTISGRGATAADYFYAGSAVQRGALQAQNGASTWAGNIVLASNSTSVVNRIGVQDGASLTLTGTITESVTKAPLLFRAGAFGDDITLSGAGTYSYTGITQIYSTGGAVVLGADDKIPAGSNMDFQIGGSTIFDLNGFDQNVAGISGNALGFGATILNNGSSPSTLTLTNPAELPTEVVEVYPALLADGTNALSLVKNGNGTQALSGNNSYSGTTTVNAGRLEIRASQSATGDVIVNGGNIKLSTFSTLFPGVNLSIASGAFFYADGSSQTLGKLEGNGTIDFTFADAGVDVITVGENNATSTFGGVIQQSTARTYDLSKIGTGTFSLTGLSNYTGNTTIEDGTLSVAQSNFANTSTVTIGLAAAPAAVLNLPNAGTDIVAALIIDGVSQPGNGLVYGAGNSSGAITGLGKIQVGNVPGSGYASWATANNVLLGENGDDDKDGIINLIEYALGLNPQVGNLAPGSFTSNTLSFTKGTEAKAALDVTYKIETSTTLNSGSWTEAAATETTNAISFQLPPNQPGGKLFARLKVSKP